jgi:RND family efflux transporter MFP subunit
MSNRMISSTTRSRKGPVRFAALLLLGLTGIGAVAVTTVAQRPAAAPAPKPAPETAPVASPSVTIEAVSAQVFDHPIRVTGTLKSDEVVALSTKATGLIRQVLAKEGDRVRQGQLLVRIDDNELRAQRAKAAAAARSAEARLKQARTSRGIRNAAAEADYRRAQQALAAAQTRLSQARSLAKISATEVESNVESARANLQSAREQLKVRQEGARRQEKAAAELEVTRAQAQADKLKGQLERREQLVREGAIAREEVENARRDYEVAVAIWNAAKQQADLLNEGSRSEEIRIAEEAVRQAEAAFRSAEANRARRRISNQDVETAETQVRQAEAELDRARAGLAQREWNSDEIQSAQAALAQSRADVRYYDELIAQTRIYSPVNGVVSQRQAHVGETVSQGNANLMTLVATDTLYFEATAPEGERPYLRVGLPADVTLDALPGQTFAGVVREIIPVAEGANRSIRLRLSVPRVEPPPRRNDGASGGTLLDPPERAEAVVGGFARATLRGQSQGPVLTVPRAALVSDEGERAVFVYQEGKAVWRPVRVGATNQDRVEILEGVQQGEPVIVQGAEALTDGQAVTLEEGRRTPAGRKPAPGTALTGLPRSTSTPIGA